MAERESKKREIENMGRGVSKMPTFKKKKLKAGAERKLGRSEGERVQPIRDEMELLESERRILSPGCCTEEREVGREGGREGGKEGGRDRGWETKEGRGTELRTNAKCNPTVFIRQ